VKCSKGGNAMKWLFPILAVAVIVGLSMVASDMTATNQVSWRQDVYEGSYRVVERDPYGPRILLADELDDEADVPWDEFEMWREGDALVLGIPEEPVSPDAPVLDVRLRKIPMVDPKLLLATEGLVEFWVVDATGTSDPNDDIHHFAVDGMPWGMLGFRNEEFLGNPQFVVPIPVGSYVQLELWVFDREENSDKERFEIRSSDFSGP